MLTDIPRSRLAAAFQNASQALLAEQSKDGSWAGRLSSSALSTATAITALSVIDRSHSQPDIQRVIQNGLDWLTQHANPDGGWGDTTLSLSNLSTTTLAWAAFGAVPHAAHTYASPLAKAEAWLIQKTGGLDPDQLAPAIIARYGKDRTFSVPILTMCAIAGRLGEGRDAWRHVIPLPFELAACPSNWFAALRLPVVSYALPALIAIGQARFHHAPPANPLTRLLRRATRQRTLRVLQTIQPQNGGFLEATPLTSFVTMSLGSIGLFDHPVTRRGVSFLLQSQLPDGSWPIDTNLATWLTTLTVHALGEKAATTANRKERTLQWLLSQQYRQPHPYTNAAPGGWAWTNLPGGVPDADDTAGALLALLTLGPSRPDSLQAAWPGLQWLLNLQNRDGGIPTFCRGWGTLPFDRSSADITAHALRAWLAWRPSLTPSQRLAVDRAIGRATLFLARTQRPNGAWVPLWFGNQYEANEENPTYGTSRIIPALAALVHASHPTQSTVSKPLATALNWLVHAQNVDGGWGGSSRLPSTVEESALAVEALAVAGRWAPDHFSNVAQSALCSGTKWLLQKIESGSWTQVSPIGFYFAKLWYYEQLYPLIFTVSALHQLLKLKADD